ncbi:hypothetical protein [Paenibacillus lemnae]|uniref:Uncharacterized protein n=1 Tax=Paenibacillus lemnae TaxID=1330551 RepID=A0A848M8H2_PAELE|nr:hypothetical protein [Paenibacillus lemnae]NMO96569.1 hypothetical protein [Paenibacillus lemnae]
MRLIKAWLAVILLLILCSCQQNESVIWDHVTVEAFVIEQLEEEDGMYVFSGYQKVNSITYVKDNDREVKTRIRAIEDYYDQDGKYIETKLSTTYSRTLKNTQSNSSHTSEDFVKEPLTIHLDDEVDQATPFYKKTLTVKESEEVKEQVVRETKHLK